MIAGNEARAALPMADTGRTIRVLCLCELGRDHGYRDGSEGTATAVALSRADRSEQG